MSVRYDKNSALKLLSNIEHSNDVLKYIGFDLIKEKKNFDGWNDNNKKAYIAAINSTLSILSKALENQSNYQKNFLSAIKKLESE